jgi:tRNA(Ile)-lysidine synthase
LTAGPALLVVRRAVRAALGDLPENGLVLVGCSGGADSLALAAGAAISGHRGGAVVVDHGLQAGSDRVAAVAARQCDGLGLDPVEVVAVEVGERGGPEAAARDARRAALREAAQRHGAAAVLLAHTLDDQAETVLLRLARGSGARSLAGMPAADGLFRRPLLGLRRDLVRAACDEAGLEAHEDPHNADDRFARARLRHHGLPALVQDLGGGVVLGLARSAASLREDNEALDRWASAVHLEAGAKEVTVPTDALTLVPAAVRLRVVRRMALEAGCPGAALTREHILAVAGLVTAWRGQGPVDLPGGVRARRRSGRLVVSRTLGRDSAR